MFGCSWEYEILNGLRGSNFTTSSGRYVDVVNTTFPLPKDKGSEESGETNVAVDNYTIVGAGAAGPG